MTWHSGCVSDSSHRLQLGAALHAAVAPCDPDQSWTPHSACPALHPAAPRKLLDTPYVSADRRAHRAARLASDVMMFAERGTGRWIIAGSGVAEERSCQRQRLRDL